MICQNGIVTVVINVRRLHPHPNNLTKMISNFEDKIANIIQSKSNSIFRSWSPGHWPGSNKPRMDHCNALPGKNSWAVSLAGYL